MRNIRPFTVTPQLPERLQPLRRLAFNLWWAWNHDAIELFRRVDRKLWDETNHDPVRLIGTVPQERMKELAAHDGFLAHMDRVAASLDEYLGQKNTWFNKNVTAPEDALVAYFSFEYGLSENLPIYSGGLGVLAGDHLKSASDLGLPLVAVGLLYHEGYFHQYLNADGWQQESYPENDFYNMPLKKMRHSDGRPMMVDVTLGGRTVTARIWRLQVGRVPLYLLDCDVDSNRPEDRDITARLYGGDLDMRIRQEIMLGVGGLRALRVLGLEPTVRHMNEGHSAFLSLERARQLMADQGLTFTEALEASRAGNVFTTHTPVPAGNDRFPPEALKPYFEAYSKELGISWDAFLALGRERASDATEPFCMTVLALRAASRSNGVSELHGHVSRNMWADLWQDFPEDEVPIFSITNGVHTRTWISREMAGLFDRYMGPRWVREPHDREVWARVWQIPDEELWRTHERRRERLVAFARDRLGTQLARRGAGPRDLRLAEEVLDPEALTIGFARRFAPYKRATLLFRDLDRLRALLDSRDRPVQILLAGKAHPADERGKEFIRRIIHAVRDTVLRRRVVFIEDYDMEVARYLVQGADVWLNTPRRPLEASGTSGMKAAANGGLNLSVLDGWWCEAYEAGHVGWSIGAGEEYDDMDLQDEVESNALFDLLEQEIVPLFYHRTAGDLPRKWIDRMKKSMETIGPHFNTDRMVSDYLDQSYRPAWGRVGALSADSYARARGLAAWKERVQRAWPGVRVLKVEATSSLDLTVGDELRVAAEVSLGDLSPEEVSVELYAGRIGAFDALDNTLVSRMETKGAGETGTHMFTGSFTCLHSGRHGYTVRVLPRHADLVDPRELALITWG